MHLFSRLQRETEREKERECSNFDFRLFLVSCNSMIVFGQSRPNYTCQTICIRIYIYISSIYAVYYVLTIYICMNNESVGYANYISKCNKRNYVYDVYCTVV